MALRHRTVAALCTVLALLLVATAARAAVFDVTSDFQQDGRTYDGDILALDKFGSVTAPVVNGQITNAQVQGSGLTVRGYSSKPVGLRARLQLSIVATTVTDAPIVFSGFMPPNTNIRVVSTTAAMESTAVLFDLSGLALQDNVTVTLEDISATWTDSATSGSIAKFGASTSSVGIQDVASLFVIDAHAIKAKSVFSMTDFSALNVRNGSTLAVDYSSCEECTGALVYLTSPLSVDATSVFRVSHCAVTGGSGTLLTSIGGVSVNDNSLYLISDCTTDTGAMFDYGTSNFKVSDNSVATFYGLSAPSLGISKDSRVPTSVDETSHAYGGNCTVGGTKLESASQYQDNGLDVDVVDDNGRLVGSDECAYATCLPGNIIKPEITPEVCSCVCKQSSNYPSCTAGTDPTQNYDGSGSGSTVCGISGCAKCDRLNRQRCTKCESDYYLDSDFQCAGGTTTTTTTTTTASPTAVPCKVKQCALCHTDSDVKCARCEKGYVLTSSATCIYNNDGARLPSSLLTAAAVLFASGAAMHVM